MRHLEVLHQTAFALISLGLALPLLQAFELPAGSAPGDRTVIASAWIAAIYWYVGAGLLTANLGDERPPGRIWWATGCAFAWLHTAIAFHAAHGWSHAVAFEHTERVGGFGAGVYVNYLFLAVWTADAAWMWTCSRGYRHRPRWLAWAVHGFLAFVVFNATVVFGSGVMRWVALAAFAWMAWEIRSGSLRRVGRSERSE